MVQLHSPRPYNIHNHNILSDWINRLRGTAQPDINIMSTAYWITWITLISAATGIVALLLTSGARKSRKRIEAGHKVGADIALFDLLRYIYLLDIPNDGKPLYDSILPSEGIFDEFASRAKELIEKIRFAYPEEVDHIENIADVAKSIPSIIKRVRYSSERDGGRDYSAERALAEATCSFMGGLMEMSYRASKRQKTRDTASNPLKPSINDLFNAFQQRHACCEKEVSRLSKP